MRRLRPESAEHDAAVAAELAVAERAVRRALAALDGQRRASFGDYDARRAVARTRRDLERCIEAIRAVRPVGTVGGEPDAKPTARRPATSHEVAE
ncbi:MAG: hypothetical protein EBT79_02220 [Actinobacteria bacterium]|nr:hypothetical protein [Actinomycetota bacterium]NBR66090.1 hypothetical protein [Actinomycetota bacterium]